MLFSLCKLRDLGLVNNNGTLPGYQYTADQCTAIIRKLWDILNKQDISDYLLRCSDLPYPECIVRQIIHKNKRVLMAAVNKA